MRSFKISEWYGRYGRYRCISHNALLRFSSSADQEDECEGTLRGVISPLRRRVDC